MKTNILRQKYISYFLKHGHTHAPSASLVPGDDPTLLFTGAGMNQFKAQFLGKEIIFNRAVTCQKCLRTDDLIHVGKTPGHHTFFEMLGNFSFGDYFKEGAISFAWEFITKELLLNTKRLWVSVYEEDEEAYSIWEKVIHFPKDRIVRLNDKENFWPAEAAKKGPNGPCGPCSEIFYDQGEKYGCKKSNCNVSCSCGRFVEIWNLVFTQFNRMPDGTLSPLPQKNIDTGMGLERTAAVLQGVPNNFEIDLIFPILKNAAEIARVKYGSDPAKDISLRIITDHLRAITFTISDGVFPSNDGRGYVLRRLIRLALRQGMNLGVKKPFLYRLIHMVNRQMVKAYPELEGRHDQISLIVKSEEEKFMSALEFGEKILQEGFKKIGERFKNSGERRILSGKELFRFYDTYGLPIEVVKESAEKQGVEVDEEGFSREMERQKTRAREGSVIAEDIFKGAGEKEAYVHFPKTKFIGYDNLFSSAKILGIVREGKAVDNISQGERGEIILDRTPFYGESGGQIGDKGNISTGDFSFIVADTLKVEDIYVHRGCVEKGEASVKQEVDACVDGARRIKISQHHTATHLLHFALRQILGPHVTQAGSYVGPDRLRFDFHHYERVLPQELDKIEQLINEKIREDSKLEICETSLSQAKKDGVTALFGEKYSERVRVVKIGSFSNELCGGIHTSSAGRLGLFIILGERAISAGLRRIEALAGEAAFLEIKKCREILGDITGIVKVKEEKLAGRVEEILLENKKLQKEIARRKTGEGESNLDKLVAEAKIFGETKFIMHRFKDYSMENLRDAADRLKKKISKGIGALASVKDNKVSLIVFVTPSLINKFKANEIIKDLGNILGGGGGGRPDLAQAGGKDPSKIAGAFKALEEKVNVCLLF